MARGHRYGGSARRARLRKIISANRYDSEGNLIYRGDICHICGKVIDLNLKAPHPGAYELDDILPVSQGGDPLSEANLASSHSLCNKKRQNKPIAVAIRDAREGWGTSRAW
jgi:hypothetical protein